MEKAMVAHSSTLAWKIPWTEEPVRLQSMGSRRVGHEWTTSLLTFHSHALEKEMANHSSALAWKIPGTGEPGGLPSMGSQRIGHDWSNLAAAAADVKWNLAVRCVSTVQCLLVLQQYQGSGVPSKIFCNKIQKLSSSCDVSRTPSP